MGETLPTILPELQVWQINCEADCSEVWEEVGGLWGCVHRTGGRWDVSALCLAAVLGDAPGPSPSFGGVQDF